MEGEQRQRGAALNWLVNQEKLAVGRERGRGKVEKREEEKSSWWAADRSTGTASTALRAQQPSTAQNATHGYPAAP